MTTAALAVPIVLLRRQRAKALLNVPPPRRIGDPSSLHSRYTPTQNIPPSDLNEDMTQGQWPPPRRRTSRTMALQSSRFTPRVSASAPLSAVESDELHDQSTSNDDFNSPLYTARAFGLATLIVALCASTAVWSVKTTLDVKDTQEFADQMRHIILTKLPSFSRRIHRRPLDGDDDGESPVSAPDSDADLDWKWSEAEERLETALDKGGPYAWAEAAMREMEHEARKTRRERGLEDSNNNHSI